MSRSDKYFDIPFAGLKIGTHTYDFEVNDSFFEGITYSLVQKGKLHVSLELEKKETMLIAHFKVNGTVETECDRCNAPLVLPLQGTMKLIYKFGYEAEEDETLVVLHPEEYQINVEEPIYELIMLSLPNRKVHPKGECDEEMRELIQKYTINPGDDEEDDEFNDEDPDEDDDDWWDEEDEDEEADDPEDDDDPDWTILKNLN